MRMDDGVLCRPSPKRQSGRGGAGLALVELDRRLAVGRGFPMHSGGMDFSGSRPGPGLWVSVTERHALAHGGRSSASRTATIQLAPAPPVSSAASLVPMWNTS
jgi:hypothetical protein